MAVDGGAEVVVETGDGPDQVEIGVDAATLDWVVAVNGTTSRYPAGARLVVRTGDGDDEVTVAAGVRIGVTIYGGPGADRIRGGAGADQIWGGDGRDYIDAGQGNDTVHGGRGEDTIYGLDGDDDLHGGQGRDYVEGGRGDDRIDGGAGNDTLSGGPGDDTVLGGSGQDHIYAGPGQDTVDGGAGVDGAYVLAGDVVTRVERIVTVELRTVGNFIRVEGSPAFVDRVRADLDMLRTSPRGQALLAALAMRHDATRSRLADVPLLGRLANPGDTVVIREYISHSREEDNSFAFSDTSRRPGRQMLVEYQVDLLDVYDGPPVTVLYHELAHIYDYAHDTLADGVHTGRDNPGVDNAERVATGLPVDHDGRPATPRQLDPRHPYDFTENGLRDEMGTRRAPRY